MKMYVIERDIPAVGGMNKTELSGAAKTSNDALAQLNKHKPSIQWHHSYVTADKTFCIYSAESEHAIKDHAKISGFPASVITEVTGIIDPTT